MSRFPRLRKVFFWLHLVAGLGAGVIILIMAASGLLISFERQITEASDGFHLSPPSAGVARMELPALLTKLRETEAGARPTGFLLNAEPSGAAGFQFGRERTVFMNPWTGEVLGEGATNVRAFFRQVTAVHRWLALTGTAKDAGQAVTSAAALVFLFIILSGLLLWIPKRWSVKAVKAAAILRPGLKGRARDWNWHNALGIWAALPLLLTVTTGLIIAYPWANRLLFNAVGESPPERKAPPGGPAKPGGGGEKVKNGPASGPGSNPRASADSTGPEQLPDGVDKALAAAIADSPNWQQVQFSFTPPPSAGGGGGSQKPAAGNVAGKGGAEAGPGTAAPRTGAGSAKPPLTLFVSDSHRGRPDLRREISFDLATATIIETKEFSSQSTGRQLRTWVRWLHTGEALGWIGQTISALACAALLILIWTGFALSWRRFFRKRQADSTAVNFPPSDLPQ